jgi:thiol-disulfide isomerase/thioredoxin
MGQEVNLDAHLLPGKVTIVDFYSEGCAPCRMIGPLLHAAVERDPGVSLRVVDINRPGIRGIDWTSPVARQHGLSGIPFFVVFDGNGTERARGKAAAALIGDWIKESLAKRQETREI